MGAGNQTLVFWKSCKCLTSETPINHGRIYLDIVICGGFEILKRRRDRGMGKHAGYVP